MIFLRKQNQLYNFINYFILFYFILYFLHISVKIKTAIVDLTKAPLL